MKKNSQAKWVVISFFIIVCAMILLNQKGTLGVTRIPMPNNKGFPRLTSMGNQLIAAESGGGFYVFEWLNIQAGYKRFPAASENSILLNQEPRLSLSYVAGDNALVLLEEDGNKVLRIANNETPEQAHLITGPNQETIYIINQISTGSEIGYVLKKVDIKKEYLRFICELKSAPKFELRAFAISDSEMLLAASGKKEGRGYLAVSDVKAQKVLWEMEYPESTDISSLSFSTHGQFLFVGSEEGSLSMVSAETGEIVKSVVLVDQPRKNTNSRTIQTVVTSSKGQWVACVCDPEIFILDQATCTLHKTIGSSHKIVTGLVFSPDEKMLATSDLRASGVINVIDLDKFKTQ